MAGYLGKYAMEARWLQASCSTPWLGLKTAANLLIVKFKHVMTP